MKDCPWQSLEWEVAAAQWDLISPKSPIIENKDIFLFSLFLYQLPTWFLAEAAGYFQSHPGTLCFTSRVHFGEQPETQSAACSLPLLKKRGWENRMIKSAGQDHSPITAVGKMDLEKMTFIAN